MTFNDETIPLLPDEIGLTRSGRTLSIKPSGVTGDKIGITSQTTGDILYYNGSTWVRLPIGSANNILSVSSGVPAWTTNAGALELIEHATLSAASTKTFSSLGSYEYLILKTNLNQSARNGLRIRFNGDTGANYNYNNINLSTGVISATGAATGIECGASLGAGNIVLNLSIPTLKKNGSNYRPIGSSQGYLRGPGTILLCGEYFGSANITSITLDVTAGSDAAGTVTGIATLYGVRTT